MQPNRRTLLKRVAVLGGVGLAGCSETDPSEPAEPTTPTEPPADLAWTGRYVAERNLAWATHRKLSSDAFAELFDDYRDDYVIVDVGATPTDGGVDYSMVWRENVDGRAWAERRDLSSEEYHEYWEQYDEEGLRPLTVEGYLVGDELQFAGIWVENREDLEWWSRRNMTNDEFVEHFESLRDDGMRPIELETYQTGSGPRIASIWYENVDDVEWYHYRDMSREKYLERVENLADDGFRMIDFESYVIDGERLYGAIWERRQDDLADAVRTDRTSLQYSNWLRAYADMGLRVVDVEQYDDRFGGIWLENAERYRYERKDEIDAVIEAYKEPNKSAASAGPDIPGISVAVIRDGEMLYRRGFGHADVAAGREAHARTVYAAASVSKVFGGTLAARLESVGELRDGTPVDLDMSDHVGDHLTDAEVPGDPDAELPAIPAVHDYAVEDLFAHLACVPHYAGETIPGIDNPTTHYETATEAAADLWTLGLVRDREADSLGVQPCTPGETESYSTYGFTLAGAVLEQVTGRRIARLVREELTEPLGLESTRTMFADESLTPDRQRAVPYDDGPDDPDSYSDNSWKVLGGGLESTAVDLARFGWAVLDGQVVDPDVRDERLWSPVHEDCTLPASSGTTTSQPTWAPPPDSWGDRCAYGIAWDLDNYDFGGTDYFVADHGGCWTGAGAKLSVVPAEGLVFAAMSNRSGCDQNLADLMDDVVETVID